MFPFLPILILLLLGPANAERLAAEGRLPAGLLAVHLAHVAPVRATVVAPVEEASPRNATLRSGRRPLVAPASPISVQPAVDGFQPANPTRAGPQVA